MKKTTIKTIYGQIEGVVAHAMAQEGKCHMIAIQYIPENHLFNEKGQPAVCALVFTPKTELEFDNRVKELYV